MASLFGAVLVSAVATALAAVDAAEAAGDALVAAEDAAGEAEDALAAAEDDAEDAEGDVDVDGVVPQPATSRANAVRTTANNRWVLWGIMISSITMFLPTMTSTIVLKTMRDNLLLQPVVHPPPIKVAGVSR